jgi:D-alanyl-D-alanine carboxypeptidase
MCEATILSKIVSIVSLLLCLLIPIIYFIYYLYLDRNNKEKSTIKGGLIAIIIFVVLILIKLLISISNSSCLKCYINNSCNKENTTTKSETTETTTTITAEKENIKTVEQTTNSYKKLDYITGDKIDEGLTSNGYKIERVNDVTYIDGYMIANKTYSLPSTYYPLNANKNAQNTTNTCNDCIDETVYQAAQDLITAAKKENLNIWIQSGYRSYTTQKNIYDAYVKRDGKTEADTYSSRAGYSEHQTGYAFDLNSVSDEFGNTNEGKWVAKNCWKYGFIIRFPDGKESETGYKYESWHLRYVGYDLAKILYNDGNWLSFESYFGITSVYED